MIRYGWNPTVVSIMSGDSPHSHNDIIDYIDGGRNSPTPTTSKDPQALPNSVVQASVLVEPEKDREEDERALCSPILNNPTCDEIRDDYGQDKTLSLDDLDYDGKKKDKNEKRKMNGEADKLDGVYLPNNNTSKKQLDEEEEDDNCLVNCLYYTMQCCECVIV